MSEKTQITDELVSSRIDGWKRKLLDLTKRNRALNFKTSKVSTVTIVDELPAEVFRHLFLEEKGMHFKSAPDDEVAPPAESNSEDHSEDDDDANTTHGADFVPYDSSSLNERHTDEFLQTSVGPDTLDKSLRRIDEQARVSIEEQGVNTLFLALGMLHHRESRDSEITSRAPIVMLPVKLERKSARSGYSILAADDDPLVNPALREYLKRNFALTLAELPESDLMPDDYDLQALLSDVATLIADQKGWSVKSEICLGLFSFQKFLMYKDLEANNKAIAQHGLLRQLITRTGEQVIGLPEDIREMDLDQAFPPETSSHVVDADSSQLRALAASAHGRNLVIEGPPGTGKSQTITNLVAQALGANKSVLFVAEKMAALDVVHRRLQEAGLGEFCLEVHSAKANKRRVMQDLAVSLDASLQPLIAPTHSTQRLPQVRRTLNDYVHAIHEPFGTLGVSPFFAYGELAAVLAAPRMSWSGDPLSLTREEIAQTGRDLLDLVKHAAMIDQPGSHPWRHATKTFYSPGDLEAIEEAALTVLASLDEVTRLAEGAAAKFGLASIRGLAEVETASAVANALSRSPGASAAVLNSEAWNVAPAQATELVARVKNLRELRDRIAVDFEETVLDREHSADIDYIERKSGGRLSFFAFFDARYRAIRKSWREHRRPGYAATLLEQASRLREVDQLLIGRRDLDECNAKATDLFGSLWDSHRSDSKQLADYISWVTEIRALAVKHDLSSRTLEVATTPSPDVSDIYALCESTGQLKAGIVQLKRFVGWPDHYFLDDSLVDIGSRIRQLVDRMSAGPQWAGFESVRITVAKGRGADLLAPAMSGQVGFEHLPDAFKRAFYMAWLTHVVTVRPALTNFHVMTHEERVGEFRELDARVLQENRIDLVGRLRKDVQVKLRGDEAALALPFLRREMAKQRHRITLRNTMRKAEAAIRAIKPCFLMSPLTVAQYLNGGAPSFDLVIFDEASQLPSEDAVGAILRGRQLVVVGDPKQLPPSTFFSASSDVLQPNDPIEEDAESVLEEFMGAGIPMSRLKWHYRSTHESLITFSNVNFYDSDLYTFPSVETGTDNHGLSFEYVDGGVYEGKGLNVLEARRVADEVVRFAREQLAARESGKTMLSLGVGTFNLRQQLAIQDEIEIRRREHPEIELFFDRSSIEPFFVKNLENIQGDERDVIFISVTYAKGIEGKLRLNFGPLNGKNGWRRLNVLTTRARRRMRVFSSMHGEDINPAAASSDGPRLLREFLLYAEHGRLETTFVSLLAQAESPFEREVIRELTSRGVKVVPQVGVAGYRIDIGVLDDEILGRFICAIECDGVAYHSSATARDRDRLRQQVLEGRGWRLMRVWSTDWFKDRVGQVDRLMKFIESASAQEREETREAKLAEERAKVSEDAQVTREVERVGDPPCYVRPSAAAYAFTQFDARFVNGDILTASNVEIDGAIIGVVETEAPVHLTDLLMRVAGKWGTKAGSRIQERILERLTGLTKDAQTKRRGDFVWGSGESVLVRSRMGTKIPADRIAPEEFETAVLSVLATGNSFSRPQLVNEVRAVFGFQRTGAIIEEAVTKAIAHLLEDRRLGEGSTGLVLIDSGTQMTLPIN